MFGIGNDKSWNVSSRVDIRSHVKHCTDDSSLPSNTSLMIERCGGLLSAAASDASDSDASWLSCSAVGVGFVGVGCGELDGDAFRLLTEFERALFGDSVE